MIAGIIKSDLKPPTSNRFPILKMQGVVVPAWAWGRAQRDPYVDYMHCRNLVYNMLRLLRYNFRREATPLTIPRNLDGTPSVHLGIVT